MELRVLGPVEAWRDGELVNLGSRQHRLILAVLALEAGRVVSVDRLVDLLWPEAMPKNPRSAIQVRVSQLRSALGQDTAIEGSVDGYRLDLRPGNIDAHRFRALLNEARQLSGSGERVRMLREALALWRGDALSGAISEERILAGLCSGLEESRLAALEDCLDAELELGIHGQVVDELFGLVGAHPGRERFVAQLMLALHRSGQSPKALEVGRGHRTWIGDELGLDPGQTVQDLETAILRDDPALRAPSGPPDRAATRLAVPAQLPPVAGGFTGREQQLLELDLLLPAADKAPHAKQAVITGTAGVGKTSLAVYWAQRAVPHFEDGQIYLDLRGYATGPARTPHDALTTLLHGLGVEPNTIPADTDDAAAMFRSQLNGKKVLLLLDNARDAEQVRPLLPGSADTLTLITSRERLSGLVAREGAARIRLDALAPDEAVSLLTELVGAVHDTSSLADLARTCAYLPLALRIAAAHLADDPHLGIQDYLTELREHPLADLAVEGDVSVAAALDVSYERLDAEAQRLYRCLGLLPGFDWGQSEMAALLGRSVRDVRPALRRLVTAHLVEEYEGRRYRFHDLLRDHAARQAEREDDAASRDEALERLLSWYFVNLDEVTTRSRIVSRLRVPAPSLASPLPPTAITDLASANGWWHKERSNLVAAILHCGEHGRAAWACQLAAHLRGFLHERGFVQDERVVCEAACRAAEQLGDDLFLADAYSALGKYHAPRDPQIAIEQHNIAMRHARHVDNPEVIAKITYDLGVLWLYTSEASRAHEAFLEVLAHIDAGQPIAPRTFVLANLAACAASLGRFAEALEYEREIVELARVGHVRRRGIALANYAATLSVLDRMTEAQDAAEQAVVVAREEGVPFNEGFAHYQLGNLASVFEQWDTALHHAELCAEIGERISAPMLTSCADLVRGAAHHGMRDYAAALACWRRAATVAREASQHEAEAEALLGSSQTEIELDELRSAREHAEAAMRISQTGQIYDLVGRSHAALAAVELAEGQPAVENAQRALEIHRDTGHVRAERMAAALLERAKSGTRT